MPELSPLQTVARLSVCVAVGVVIWFMPVPEGLVDKVDAAIADGQLPAGAKAAQAWQLFAVFLAVIVGFITRPFSMGPVVLVGMVTLMLTHTVNAEEIMRDYGNKTTWLIVAAFLIAGAVLRTGLGRRLALLLVCGLGRSTLGLGYAICGAELILGPFIPSNTARGGGLMAPITRSLAEALDSHPHQNPNRVGSFLVLVGGHACVISSAMFLTAMAANPIVVTAASEHLHVDFGFGTWLAGSIVPGLASLALLPLVIYAMSPPELKDARRAQDVARQQLAEMGPPSYGATVLGLVFVGMVLLWATKSLHGIHEVGAAWLGIVVLVLLRVEKWSDVVGNQAAWDTLIWLGGLLSMANLLNKYQFIDFFADLVQHKVEGYSPMVIVIVLTLVYLYSMYCFSMMTAHISAMAAPFFIVASLVGAPPKLIVPLIAYFSCLCACLTNYSTGPMIIYFGHGYVAAPRWFKIGFVMSLLHIAVWFTIGLAWWKLLGWW